jgi:GNAT superfamily N-acetyltransferase
MVGTERVLLIPAIRSAAAFAEIWDKITKEPDAKRWFAPTKPAGYEHSTANPLVCVWFLLVIFILFLDCVMDPDEWNAINVTFMAILVAMLITGAIFAGAGIGVESPIFDQQRHHGFVARMGAKDIGVADIYEDVGNRTCMIEVALLPEFRGQKFGSVVGRLLIRKCFTELNAYRVESTALSTNDASMKMHDGMIAEGILKDRYTVHGQPVSEHWFRLLRPEWDAQIAARKSMTSA